ncbi:MAG TPA: Fe-S cluster assembly protein IscX [Anaerolineae bacterium]|jgi:FeS assembly protein IscX
MADIVVDPLYWDDAYPIALALRDLYPLTDPGSIEQEVLHGWVVSLRDFVDDPAVRRSDWLEQIQAEWLELT